MGTAILGHRREIGEAMVRTSNETNVRLLYRWFLALSSGRREQAIT